MNQDLRLFFEKLFSEPEFRQKFMKTKSAEEGYEKAKPYIGEVSFDEFKAGLTIVHNKFFSKHYKELDNGELSRVSGGRGDMFVEMLGSLVGSVSLEDILKN